MIKYMKKERGRRDYSLIINNLKLSEAIMKSDDITGYEQSKTNGFDGETYTMFIATLGVIVQIASFIIELCSNNNDKIEDENNSDDETKITVITPDGYEYRNVPLSKVSDLISVLKAQD